MQTIGPTTAKAPLIQGSFRGSPEDFLVEELPLVTPSGDGAHLWVSIRKCGYTTDRVASILAKLACVRPRDIGYAGLKDRHAVTTQWFSIPWSKPTIVDWACSLPDGIELLDTRRHTKKLKRGVLSGNRFQIVIRDAAGDWEGLQERLKQLSQEGVPNYFGEQRFGRGGENVNKALAMFRDKRLTRRGFHRGIYLSAARSWLFNQVLAERVKQTCWDIPIEGDVMVLAGSRSFFVAETVDENLLKRVRSLDVHPSGPLWGIGDVPVLGAGQRLELAIVHPHHELCLGLERAGLHQERRPLRMSVHDLTWDIDSSRGVVRLMFRLDKGGYATAVLRELLDIPRS